MWASNDELDTAIPWPKKKKSTPPPPSKPLSPNPPAPPSRLLFPQGAKNPVVKSPVEGKLGGCHGGGGADKEWTVSEGVVVDTWDDGLSEGEWCVEMEEWVKTGNGKKRKSKAMYAVVSALLFKTKDEVEAYLPYLRSSGLGNGEDGDNGNEGEDRGKDGDGGEPPARNPPSLDMESDSGALRAGHGECPGQGRIKWRGMGKGVGVASGCPLGPQERSTFHEQVAAHVTPFNEKKY